MNQEELRINLEQEVRKFLIGDEEQAKVWFREAERQGKEAWDFDRSVHKPELQAFVNVALGAMLWAAKYTKQ